MAPREGRTVSLRYSVSCQIHINSRQLVGASSSNPEVKFVKSVPVSSGVLSLLLQASGSGVAGANYWQGEEKDVGMAVLVAGLVLQLVTFSLFLVLVVWFDVKTKPGYSDGVRLVLNGIYVAGSFMMVRLIYRVVEFSMGIDTYAWNHEWLLYVLEAAPIFIALMVLGWYHPSRWIKLSFGGRER